MLLLYQALSLLGGGDQEARTLQTLLEDALVAAEAVGIVLINSDYGLTGVAIAQLVLFVVKAARRTQLGSASADFGGGEAVGRPHGGGVDRATALARHARVQHVVALVERNSHAELRHD